MKARPVFPEIEAMFTMAPSPRARSSGSAAWVTRTTPLTLTAIIRSNCASVSWSNGPPTRTPALFTTTSSLPRPATVSADHAAGVGGAGDVARDAEGADPPALDAPDRLVEVGWSSEPVSDGPVVRRAQVGGGDVDALAGQGERDPTADAAGGSGHEGDLAGELHGP